LTADKWVKDVFDLYPTGELGYRVLFMVDKVSSKNSNKIYQNFTTFIGLRTYVNLGLTFTIY
jgi:hypothetical protein